MNIDRMRRFSALRLVRRVFATRPHQVAPFDKTLAESFCKTHGPAVVNAGSTYIELRCWEGPFGTAAHVFLRMQEASADANCPMYQFFGRNYHADALVNALH